MGETEEGCYLGENKQDNLCVAENDKTNYT